MGKLDELKGGTGMFRKGPQASAEAAEQQEQPAQQEQRPPRRNTYPGNCRHCGGHIKAEGGRLGPKVDGRWTVEHDGACPLPMDLPAKQAEEKPATSSVPVRQPLLEGKYTVVLDGGDTITVRVRKQDDDDDFMPGALILGYLSGPNNQADYKSFANVTERGTVYIWKKHQANERLQSAVHVLCSDPIEASMAYGLQSKHCGLCGRELTVKASIERGIGPKCAERWG